MERFLSKAFSIVSLNTTIIRSCSASTGFYSNKIKFSYYDLGINAISAGRTWQFSCVCNILNIVHFFFFFLNTLITLYQFKSGYYVPMKFFSLFKLLITCLSE